MRSIRLRFFLVTWPLVLVATAGVALAFDRWADRELTVLDEGVDEAGPPLSERVRETATAWARGELGEGRLAAELDAAARADSVAAVVLSPDGGVVASTDTSLTVEGDGRADPVSFLRSRERGAGVERMVARVAGQPLIDAAGNERGRLFVLRPPDALPPADLGAALRADARRTLLVSLGAAAGVSALLTLLVAAPIVRQIGRLAEATGRIRAGDLAVRVPPGSDDELGRLEQGFNEMAEELERAAHQRRNLVSDVAHELRTPLTNLVGTLQALEDGLRSPDEPTLETLRREARLLTVLVEDLQELSLAEAGQLEFRTEAVHAAGIVHDVLVAFESSGVEVELRGPDPSATPALVLADARRLSQVIRNLVSNAVTHTPSGGTVSVECVRHARVVEIAVRDTGRGIPEAELPYLWERFRRVEASRDRRRGGSGLGLAIVRQFVETMGGSVGVESRLGQGSTFRIRLPRADAERGPPTESA